MVDNEIVGFLLITELSIITEARTRRLDFPVGVGENWVWILIGCLSVSLSFSILAILESFNCAFALGNYHDGESASRDQRHRRW